MLDNVQRFDMQRPPMRQHLMPVAWLLAAGTLIPHKNKLTKINMEGVKPPYLLLCNHNAFMDFSVATRAMFPHRANYVVAIDGFLKREWLLRLIGCICKRKFTRDVTLVRQLKRVVDRGDIAVLYPEARYSLCGTTAVLPESLGKLCKLLKVPVVTLMCHGHHVNSPFWNLHDRGVKPTEAEMTCLFTKEALEKASVAEVNEAIEKAFQYDDFAWQKDVVDIAGTEGRDPLEDYRSINAELAKYGEKVASLPQIVAANKCDLIPEEPEAVDIDDAGELIYAPDPVERLKEVLSAEGVELYPISAVSGEGVPELLAAVWKKLSEMPREETIFKTEYDPDSAQAFANEPFTVEYDEKNDEYVLEGPRIEKMLGYTNLDSEKGFVFFQNFLKDTGILEQLEELGIQDGDTVRMYGFSFDYYK